jgi:RNA polymerase sigma factor (sigma-70 family)
MADRVSPDLRAEFDELYRAHARSVRRHLVYLTGDQALAEDLTQEAFGRLYERLGADEVELRDPRAWLLTVASNLAYNHFRAEARRLARESSPEVAAGPDAAARQDDIDDVLDVRRALARLDSRDRVVLMLRHSGFRYAEIAEALDLAPSSVGTVLARAQRRFRETYEGPRTGADEKE